MYVSSCFDEADLLLKANVLLAGAYHVSIATAHSSTVAFLPADAHAALVVLLDAAVALVVAVFANCDTLKTSHAALKVCLPAEILFLNCTCGIGGHYEILVGELQGFADTTVNRWGARDGKIEGIFIVWAVTPCLEADMLEEAVGMDWVAEADLVWTAAGEEFC